MSGKLTHFNSKGEPRMVNVSDKEVTERVAVARSCVVVSENTLRLIDQGSIKKGDPFVVARIAGITGAKKTPDIIPMCHTVAINGVEISTEIDRKMNRVFFTAEVTCTGKTGVEMEALTSVSIAALAFYDMCKSIDRGMMIDSVCLLEKRGGKSGSWKRSTEG